MGVIISGNQLVDRNQVFISTNVATQVDGSGVPRPLSSLLNRDMRKFWICPAGASNYLSVQSFYRNRVRVIGLISSSGGQSGGANATYTVMVRTGAGLSGGTLLATYTFVYDNTNFQYGDTSDVYFVLPANAPQGTNIYYTVHMPNAYRQWSRIFVGDYVDVSDAYMSRWTNTLADPNIAASSAPGSSYARDNSLFEGTRRRRLSFVLRPLSTSQAWGEDPNGLRGTSMNDIFASQGTTGEILLLPRIGLTGSVSEDDVENIASIGMYGHFVRGGSLRMIGGGDADNELMWECPSLELDSLSKIWCV